MNKIDDDEYLEKEFDFNKAIKNPYIKRLQMNDSFEHACRVRITKCYLIEVCDKSGKELESDFCFGNYHEAKLQAEKMKNIYNKRKKHGCRKKNTNERRSN